MSSSATPAEPATAEEVLLFWFGSCPPTDAAAHQKKAQWFTKSAAFDDEIRQRFLTTIEAACDGQLDHWAAEPLGWLALLVVLDQFTRNVYRGRAESFAGDRRALQWADEGQKRGWDQELAWSARAFAYLPFEHAEDLAYQEKSVQAFQRLVNGAVAADASPETIELLRSYLDFAGRHQDVIVSFGRFPHRNAILGRIDTPAEKEYLAQPGAGF